MGQAKQKKEMMRKIALQEAESLMQPPSKIETEIVEFLSTAEAKIARRVDHETLTYMRMRPRECHQNCFRYAKSDPTSKMVTGWWSHGLIWMSHSVIEKDGDLFCLTPPLVSAVHDEPLTFVSDPHIVLEHSGATADFFRNGNVFPNIVRFEPEKIIEPAKKMYQDVIKGIDAHVAAAAFEQAIGLRP